MGLSLAFLDAANGDWGLGWRVCKHSAESREVVDVSEEMQPFDTDTCPGNRCQWLRLDGRRGDGLENVSVGMDKMPTCNTDDGSHFKGRNGDNCWE